ncbi:MAG: YhdP family protein [Pseudomonadota bacterium]
MWPRALKWLWYSVATLIIAAAVLVSLGRLLFPQAHQLKPAFEQYLAERTGAKVRIAEVHGAWRGFGPELRVIGIELLAPDSDEPLLKVARFEAALDLPRSLLSWHAVMRRFEVEGLQALVELDSKGQLVLPGLVLDDDEDSGISAQYVIDALLRQNRVAITDTEIRYRRRQGDIIPLRLAEVSLRNRRGQHQAIGDLTVHEGGNARFVLEFTDYPLAQRDQMSVYLESQSLDLARLPLPVAPLGVHLEDGDLQLQIWANWRDGAWRDGQANVALKQLQLINDEQQRKALDSVSGQLHFARANNRLWYLHGENLQWQIDGNTRTGLTVEGKVSRESEQQRWGFDIGAMQLADLMAIVQFSSAVPADLRQRLAALEASADMPRTQIDFLWRDDAVADWAIASQFEQLRYRSDDLPVLTEARGRVLVAAAGGAVRVQAFDQAIDFHQLFRAPLALQELDVALRWQPGQTDTLLTVPQARIRNADIAIDARAAIQVPAQGDAELALNAQIRNGVGANKASYLPVGIMTPQLVDYLDGAIVAADVRTAHAVLRGPLHRFPFTEHDGVFDVLADVGNAQYRFQPEWPAVTDLQAQLQFVGNSMFIAIDDASLAGWQVEQGSVVLDPMGGPTATLQVQAEGVGSGKAAFALLRNSPLQTPLQPLLDTLDADGAMHTALTLAIPLHDSHASQVRGTVSFGNASLLLKPLALPLTAARGEVSFAEFGITGGDVRMQALGGTLTAKLRGDAGGGDITVRGRASSEAVAAWYPHPVQNHLAGAFEYDGKVLLPGREQHGVQVTLQTDLQGLALNAPAPFGKTAESARPLRFVAGVDAERLSLWADYDNQLVFQAERNADESALRAELLLGGASYTGHTPGLSIRGSLPALAATDWLPFIVDVTRTASTLASGDSRDSQAGANHPETEHRGAAPTLALSIAAVDFYGLPFDAVQLGGRPTDAGYQLQLRAPALVGEVLLADEAPVRVELEKLLHESAAAPAPTQAADATMVTVDEIVVNETVATGTTPATATASVPPTAASPTSTTESTVLREPADWPELELDCKQCRFYSREFGQVQLSLRNEQQDKRLSVKAERKDLLSIALTGLWSAAEHDTAIRGRVSSRDWGALTQDWGVDLGVRESSGHVDLDLRWPNSPVDFRLAASRGEIGLELGKGYIARDTEAKERVARVFSLLGLSSLTRRLSLDFSDLFKDGLYYDRLSGAFLVADGKAVNRNVKLEGVALDLDFTGDIDFVNRRLDQKIVGTTKLNSSFPVLAGWIINPTAGVALWLMNKLFIERVEKVVFGFEFQVYGPWDNPEVIERGRREGEIAIPEPPQAEPAQPQ